MSNTWEKRMIPKVKIIIFLLFIIKKNLINFRETLYLRISREISR